jgi:hypothetical protein
VEDRLARDEDTSCFHAGLLRREAEGKQEFSPFVRDVRTRAFAGLFAERSGRLFLAVRSFAGP